MYISQYLPPDHGNSFKMLDSGPKGPRFKSTHCQCGDYRTKNTQLELSLSLLDDSPANYINSIFCYIRQMAALQLLQQRSCHNSKSMTLFIAQNLHVTAHTQMGSSNLRICTQHMEAPLSLSWYSDNIKQAGGFSCSAAPSYSDVYKSVSTSGRGGGFLLSSG
ncbi:hypothetical protein AVEN_222745-1 [Araneus ventricosus]|uniref:Uncharacterized protein n=1 Tax=Araneus ventricosus TaxID=182803 RepID=A0A4Y2AZI5_ARAVE|nr:hypothetical protein AVEN_222745-1 [Araneus ventricosus]